MNFFKRADAQIADWMARFGITLLRLSLGVVFFWFGFLKFFPGTSPAEVLASKTVNALTFGLVPSESALLLAASLETLIGVGLIVNLYLRAVLFLLLTQMLGTLAPLFLYTDEVFKIAPFVPNLEGQYIIKNLVLISSALVIGSTVRGTAIIGDKKVAKSVETKLGPPANRANA